MAQPRFVQNKGLVLLTLTSLICNIVCEFLHGIVPGILVSITDAIAAIVFSIVAIIWAIVLLIGSIPGIIRALQVSAEAAGKKGKCPHCGKSVRIPSKLLDQGVICPGCKRPIDPNARPAPPSRAKVLPAPDIGDEEPPFNDEAPFNDDLEDLRN